MADILKYGEKEFVVEKDIVMVETMNVLQEADNDILDSEEELDVIGILSLMFKKTDSDRRKLFKLRWKKLRGWKKA
jgi:pantothenate kinase